MKGLISATTLLLVFLVSCEEIIDVEGLPYEERLVINGLLYAEQDNNVIQISRTLPLNIPFDSNAAFLSDATGSITSDGITYPLEYVGYSGLYRAPGLRPEIGKSYSLSVNWRHMSAQASTTIPKRDRVDTLWFTRGEDEYGYVDFKLHLQSTLDPDVSGYPQAIVMGHYPSYPDRTSYYYNYPTLQNAKKDGSPVTFKTTIYLWNEDEIVFDSTKTVMYTYAPGYYDYYQSRRNDGDEIPGGSPAPVKWNVTGQAIGIFFGAAIDSATFPITSWPD